MDRFRVEVISKTPNPQQVIYAAMHQDYSEGFVYDDQDSWPSESKCGELIVKRLLAGERGHYGPIEHVGIVFNCGFFPHSVMQQIRTHRVGLCLAGDTEVAFGHPSLSTGELYYSQSVSSLYELWHFGRKHQRSPADAAYMRKQIQPRSILVLNTETNQLEASKITNIYCNGEKQVLEISTATGEVIKATEDHLFWTNQGWKKVKEFDRNTLVCRIGFQGNAAKSIEPLFSEEEISSEEWKEITGYPFYEVSNLGRLRSWMPRGGRGIRSKSKVQTPRIKKLSRGTQYLFVSLYATPGGHDGKRVNVHSLVANAFCEGSGEVRHLNGNSFDNRASNLALGTSKENKLDNIKNNTIACNRGVFTEISNICPVGMTLTYDIEVEHKHHNFIANGLVVHNSFDVQSNRYTGNRIVDAAKGIRDIEDVFYLRPVGYYSDRQGKRYEYTQQQRDRDLAWCLDAAKRYQVLIEEGTSEEHARGIIPFDVRQHWVVSFNARSLMHLLDLRAKPDAQLECQKLCDLIWPHFQEWVPAIAEWYEKYRLKKGRLSP